jgi:hypothetical protein
VLTALKVFGLYTWKAIVPVTLSADYSFNQIPIVNPASFETLLISVLVLSSLALILYVCNFYPRGSFGLIIFILSLLPVSNLFVSIGTIMGDRLLYFPLTGLALSIGYFVGLFFRSYFSNPLPVLICVWIIVLTALGARSIARNPAWSNELTLWKETVQTVPNSVVANYLYVFQQLKQESPNQKDIDNVMDHAQKALNLAKKFPGPTPLGPYHSYGSAIEHQAKHASNTQKRKEILEKGIQVLVNGVSALRQDISEGYEVRKGGPRAKRIATIYHDIGIIRLKLGKFEGASRAFKGAYSLNSKPLYQALMGVAKLNANKPEQGMELLKSAGKKDPGNDKIQRWIEEASRKLETNKQNKIGPSGR